MFRNKSDDEAPWDRFVRTLDPILHRASRRFRQQHGRRLALGSPVRTSTARGDVIRFPIVVRGGDREYAVATLFLDASQLGRFYDENRLEEIARQTVMAAQAHPTSPPAKPGALELSYP